MTEDVAALVLRDNYLQSLAISLAEAKGPAALDRHVRLMKALERGGHLDRALEFLPDDEVLAERAAAHRGLTRPELAVLIAYAKNTLYAELLPSDLPDDRQLVADLVRYFPRTLAKRFRGAMEKHRLRREIIATFVTNSMVNRGGITFVNDMKESTGRSASDIARAYAVTRDAFELRPLWGAIDALDGKTPASLQYEMLLAVGQLVEHATAWFLRSGLPLDDVQARLDDFRPGIAVLTRRLPELLPEEAKVVLATRTRELGERGVSPAAAERVARLDFLFAAPDIVRLGRGSPLDITEAGRVYFAIGSRFSLDRLRRAARRIKADTTWQKMAVDALVDDLFALQIELAAKVIGDGSRPADAALGAWLAAQAAHLGPLDAMLHDLAAAPAVDLAMLTVAARQVRNLAR
jgi:glutamate dehydrogenase